MIPQIVYPVKEKHPTETQVLVNVTKDTTKNQNPQKIPAKNVKTDTQHVQMKQPQQNATEITENHP